MNKVAYFDAASLTPDNSTLLILMLFYSKKIKLKILLKSF